MKRSITDTFFISYFLALTPSIVFVICFDLSISNSPLLPLGIIFLSINLFVVHVILFFVLILISRIENNLLRIALISLIAILVSFYTLNYAVYNFRGLTLLMVFILVDFFLMFKSIMKKWYLFLLTEWLCNYSKQRVLVNVSIMYNRFKWGLLIWILWIRKNQNSYSSQTSNNFL